MPTQCNPDQFDFARADGRAVVASFDGGAITSDAGALLLGATDRVLGLTRRLAACFKDSRDPAYTEHAVETLVMQRIVGIALGYEDLNDHDQLRHDPVLATLAGKLVATREDCAPRAGKSTLNRLELSRPEPGRYARIAADTAAIEALFVDLFLAAHAKAPGQITLDLDATPLHGQQGEQDRGRRPRKPAQPVLPWLLRRLLLSAAVYLLRPAFAGGEAAPLQPRWRGRIGGGRRAPRWPEPCARAAGAHSVACRQRLLPRSTDGVV
jgi:Transposase DDE domain group 1